MRATISSVQQFWISKSCYEFHQLLDPQLVLQVISCSNATYVPAMYTWICKQWRRWPSFAAASALDFLECSAYIGFDMFSLQFCCILIILCARISMQFYHLFHFHFEKEEFKFASFSMLSKLLCIFLCNPFFYFILDECNKSIECNEV